MIKDYLNAIKDILFPLICFYCNKKIQKGVLCKICEKKIDYLYPPLCKFCSNSITDNKSNVCINCRGKKYPYDRVICATIYKEPLISLLHLFKYKNYDYLGEFLASLIIKHLLKIGFNVSGYDLITVVPLHPRRLKEREYNQALILAKFISKYFKIPLKDDIIYEIKNKPSQTMLKKSERIENVKDAFITKKDVDIENKKIIILDDIFTTGATLYECSSLLKKYNPKNITLITLCKTPSK